MERYYNRIREHHAERAKCITLFRIEGDYMMFAEDAVNGATVCGLKVSNNETAGFNRNDLVTYLPKLVRAGYTVYIDEMTSKGDK